MTIDEYKSQNGIKTDEDLRNHFRQNMMLGKLPVALAWCPVCLEIQWEYQNPHNCPIRENSRASEMNFT